MPSISLFIILFLLQIFICFQQHFAIGKKYDDFELEQDAYFDRIQQQQIGLLGGIARDPAAMAKAMYAKDNTDLIYQPRTNFFNQYDDVVPIRVKPRKKKIAQNVWNNIKKFGSGIMRTVKTPWRMYSNWKDRKRADKYVDNLKRVIKQKTKEFDRMQKYLQEKAPKEMKGKGRRQSFNGFSPSTKGMRRTKSMRIFG